MATGCTSCFSPDFRLKRYIVQYTPDGDYYNLHTRPQLSKGVEKYVNMGIFYSSISILLCVTGSTYIVSVVHPLTLFSLHVHFLCYCRL